jgi:hypothetical protein
MNIYITIGNGDDDKLTQAEWADFCLTMSRAVYEYADEIYGEFYSTANSADQNALWSIFIADKHRRGLLKRKVRTIREHYKQDSAAWSESGVEFV